MSSPASSLLLQGPLGVKKKGGRIEPRHFILYSDRLDYYVNAGDLEAGMEPRGWIALDDIQECEESEDGFNLRLGPGRGLELKVSDHADLQKWLDTLEPLLEDEEDEKEAGPDAPGTFTAAEAHAKEEHMVPHQNAENIAPHRNEENVPAHQNEEKVMTHGKEEEVETLPPAPSIAQESTATTSSNQTSTGATSGVPASASGPSPPKTDDAPSAKIRSKMKIAALQHSISDWRSVFQSFNKDRSGYMDCEEFMLLIRRGLKLAPAVVQDEEIRQLFDNLDSLTDGKLNYEIEFIPWLVDEEEENKIQISRKEATERLRPSGKVTDFERRKDESAIKQLKQKLKAAAYNAGCRDWLKLFRDCDKDRSGTINENEFMLAVRNKGRIPTNLISDEDLTNLFNFIDFSGDGQVSYETEFLPWLMEDEDPSQVESTSLPNPLRKPTIIRDIEKEQQKEMMDRVKRKLRAASGSNHARDWTNFFSYFDKDNSGKIDLKEFQVAVRKGGKINSEQVTDEELESLFRFLDTDGSGGIDYDGEFLPWMTTGEDFARLEQVRKEAARKAKRVIDAEKAKKSESALLAVRKRLKVAAYSNGKRDWSKLFKDLDQNNSGQLDTSEFKSAIRKAAFIPPEQLSDAELTSLFQAVDENNDGLVCVDEFLAFLLADEDCEKNTDFTTRSTVMGSTVQERVNERAKVKAEQAKKEREEIEKAALESAKKKLKSATYVNGKKDWGKLFRDFDKDNSGEICYDEFKAIIRKHGKITAAVICDEDLQKIFGAVDTSGDGVVSYETEFMPWLLDGEDKKEEEDAWSHKSKEWAKQNDKRIKEQRAERHKHLVDVLKKKLKAASYHNGQCNWSKIFKDMKQNNDVTFDVFRNITRKAGKVSCDAVSDKDLEAVWKGMDSDGKGSLSQEEVIQWLSSEDDKTDESKKPEQDGLRRAQQRSKEDKRKEVAAAKMTNGMKGDEGELISSNPNTLSSNSSATLQANDGSHTLQWEGELEIVRGGKTNPRYFRLYEDCIEYFAISSVGEPAERRGAVALHDIAKFVVAPEAGIARISFSILLTGLDARSLDLRVPRLEDLPGWQSAFDALLAKRLGPNFVARRGEGPQDVLSARESNSDIVQAAVEGPRFLGLKKLDVKADPDDFVIAEGNMSVLKKSNLEPRHFVLFRDRFECYTSKEVYDLNEKPRSRVALLDVQDVEVVPKEGFNVILSDRSYQLRPAVADLERWAKALGEVFEFDRPPAFVPSERPSGSDDGLKKKRNEHKEDASTTSTSPSAAGSIGDKMSKDAGGMPRLIRQGTLVMDRKGKAEPRHFAVFKDRLEYYVTAKDMASGADPRGRVLLQDIREIDVLDLGFAVHLVEGRTLTLTASSQADFEAWQSAWGEALEAVEKQDGSNHQTKVHQKSEPSKQKDSVHEGYLTIEYENDKKAEPRYVVLYRDRIDIFADSTDLLHGIKPQLSIFRRDVDDLEILEDGFSIQAPDQSFTLRIKEKSDHDAWLVAFGSVFEEQEEQLPNVSQLQPGTLLSPTRMGQRHPRIIWQSMLEVQEGGRSVWKYFALFEDSLASFKSASDLAQGLEPEGRIPLDQVQDVKVGNHGFVLQFSAFNLAFRVSTEPGALSAWLAALHQVLNFTEAPISIPAPSSAATKTLSSSERIFCQGVALMEEANASQLRYLVLYGDRLEIFPDVYTHMDGKQLPATKMLLTQFTQFQVIERGFALQFQGRCINLRNSDQRSFSAWSRAWGEVEPAMNRMKLIHQGPLEIVVKGILQMQHCCLYNDRMEYFNNTNDATNGQRRRGTIQMSGVKGLQERSSSSFILLMDGNNMEMRVVGQDDMQAWVSHISKVLADIAKREKQGSQDAIPQTKQANMGTPCFGRGEESSTFEPWPAGGQPSITDKSSVMGLKFPTAPWPAPPNFSPELRKSLLALGFVRCRMRAVVFREGSVVAEVQGSKEAIEEFRRQHASSGSKFNVLGYALGDVTVIVDSGKEVQVNKPVDVVDVDAPLHSAVLGIQHGGCLSNKFFVLYRDRLDYFDDKKDAVSGLRPLGRIALSEVSEYEAYGSGFILKLMGRAIGLHVPVDDDPKIWTTFLSQALANNIPPNAKTSRDSWGMGRFKTAPAKSKAKPSRIPKPKSRDTTPRKDAGSRDTTPPRGYKSSMMSYPSRTSPSCISPGSNTSDKASNSEPWVSTRYDTRREWNGGAWAHRRVTDNVINREISIVQPRADIAEKLTGDRTDRALSSRRRGPDDYRKVNERESGGLATSRSSPEIVTAKVNEAGRCYKLSVGPDRMDVKGKVNEVGKASTGWLRKGPTDWLGHADKVGRLDTSRSAPALNGEAKTAGVSSDSVTRARW